MRSSAAIESFPMDVVGWLVFAGVLSGVVGVLAAAHWLMISRRPNLGIERLFPRQLVMLALSIIGLLLVVFALPISEGSKHQLVGLVGIVLSGMLAFSSTTVLANLLAGLLLRITKPFRIGDFITVEGHFGRVSERGLFDTEIQTETRELIALPNTYLISNPVTTVRSSGTIVTATLSLGYDVDHSVVEPLLEKAATGSGLTEPFVHILELGNYAVTYRVSGFLEETKRMISARSDLYRQVLDTLHGEGVEIMSPSFMNQRRLGENEKAIPKGQQRKVGRNGGKDAEEIAFDKAEEAEAMEDTKAHLLEEIEALEAGLKEGGEEEKERMKSDIEARRKWLRELEERTATAKGGGTGGVRP